jgi:hypothetical protein
MSGRTKLGKDGRGMLKTIFAGLLLLSVAGPALADLQRVEAVGIYGVRNSIRSKVIPRDEAIARGLWEGVSRVALELMGESSMDLRSAGFGNPDEEAETDPRDGIVPPIDGQSPQDQGPDVRLDRDSPSQAELALVESALGKDILPYTRSFRILKDKGEVPALFDDQPGVRTEYVVVVEVIVDVDRVTSALEKAGLISASATALSGEAVRLEIVGFAHHHAVETTLEALRNKMGATDVQIVEFRRALQVLSVRGPFGAEGLADRLAQAGSPELRFDAIAVDRGGRRVRVRGRWSPEEAAN